MKFTEEIIQKRRQGIGGSEVGAILGIDPFNSPYKVWLSKTGREDNSVSNKYTEAGNILEGAVAEFFQRATKNRIIKASEKQQVWKHPTHEWALGMTDRIYLSKDKVGRGVLECKTTQAQLDKAHDTWFTQLQWYLGVTGFSYGAVAWLERGLDFKYNEFEFDPDYFNFCIEEVGKFWEVNVKGDIPPEPISGDDVLKRFPRHVVGKALIAEPEMISTHERLKSLRVEIKALSEEEEQLTEAVKIAMRDNEAVMNGTLPLFTWKASNPSKVFDKERFQAENPDLYDQFIIEKEGSRRFLIK